eukprot:TRINITY_DN37703_c0_g1_i1.p1 TRINITY_DN37703_c0_g1~~TRINITY_DN37703_c0_g1_i1.p1  ORF type:complete len:275 (+),score=27.68 TRINITY_DN37703_c0_g1_i1:153-977(+)
MEGTSSASATSMPSPGRHVAAHTSDAVIVSVDVISYKRAAPPRELLELLARKPALREVYTELESGTTVLLRPEHREYVFRHLRQEPACFRSGDRLFLDDLKRWHIIVSDDLRADLADSISDLRARLQVKALDEAAIAVAIDSEQHAPETPRTENVVRSPSQSPAGSRNEDLMAASPARHGTPGGSPGFFAGTEWEDLLYEQGTFICVHIPSSLRSSVPSSGVRTVSTTDAYPREGSNPRVKRLKHSPSSLRHGPSSQSLGSQSQQESQQDSQDL